ncbi:MAG: DUF2723 domain-containing protein [Anaerolineae bacterium]|jgi:hypothetical protein|nr:DUF2723 domain-containing protein [Anaerolineae bacterium]
MSHALKDMNHESGIRRYLPWVLLWSVFFALYAATTVRDVLPADSGEFQLAAATWDILHPPGYPLYTVVGALWDHLAPLGNPAFRLNLLSAVLAATTLMLVARAVHIWTETWGLTRRAAMAGGVAAALLLGSSPTFWAQATTANIRMPTLLFGAWAFLALAQYNRGLAEPRAASRALLSLALALGLGVGHHPSLIFIALGWAVYLLLRDPSLLWQPRRWWKAVPVAALAWGIPQLYLPLRGAAIEGLQLATPGLNTWAGFWHHVLARGFSGDMFAFANAADLSLRLPLLGPLFRFQFPLLALAGIFAAWVWLLLRQRRVALALGASWVIHTFVTLTYRAPQTVEYLMPAYLPMVLVFGMGVAGAVSWQGVPLRKPGRRLNPIPALILALLVLRVMGMAPDFLKLAADTSIRERVAPLLEQAPPDALILADWHWATPLWMLQRTEGLGAGAEVAYVYPRANEDYEQVWRTWAESAQERALFSTHAYEWSEWTAAPVGGGYRLFPRPLTALPPELGYMPLEAELGPVRLLGYRIAGLAQGETAVQQGAAIEMQLAWQASGAQEPAPSLTARLFDAQGGFIINADRWLGSDTAGGEVRFTHLTLQLPLNTCAETLIPNVGVYTVDANGFNTLGELNLPALAMRCGGASLPVAHFKPGLVLWSGPFLCGVDYDTRDGAIAYLHWCGPGRGLRVQSGEAQAIVSPLGLGERQTIALPITAGARPTFALTRLDGAPAHLLAAPFAPANPEALYIPFGNAMALTGATLKERGGVQVVDLHWHGARPLVEDYAVSVRLLAGESFLGMHDMQPALSTIPTLKWVLTGAKVVDPHPFALTEQQATHATIAVYERFRLTMVGEAASIPLK